jgi:hypothetical protein
MTGESLMFLHMRGYRQLVLRGVPGSKVLDVGRTENKAGIS